MLIFLFLKSFSMSSTWLKIWCFSDHVKGYECFVELMIHFLFSK